VQRSCASGDDKLDVVTDAEAVAADTGQVRVTIRADPGHAGSESSDFAWRRAQSSA
jgi:hypothetical protein